AFWFRVRRPPPPTTSPYTTLFRSDGQPYALVLYTQSWSLTASHETLEMLADPWGSRLVGGSSIQAGQGRVRYLIEVCDPCEAPRSEEHTSELQSPDHLVCRLLLEK